jgi:nucleoside-diphosphate-sugar epimerase
MRIFVTGATGAPGRHLVPAGYPAATALHRYGMTGSVGDAEDVAQDAF